MANQLPKGPQGPRRYPGQNEAAQKQRDIMQKAKQDDLSSKMREAYENFQKSPEADTIGMKRGGKIKKMAGGGYVPNMKEITKAARQREQASRRVAEAGDTQRLRDKISTPVIPDQVKYPEYIEEIGEERISGPRMRKGGVARSSASKRADGCAVRGKTRGKMV